MIHDIASSAPSIAPAAKTLSPRKPIKEASKRHPVSIMRTISAQKITEITGSAATTCLVRLIVEAQQAKETVAYITGHSTSLYPPDLVEAGVHLSSLVFLRVDDDKTHRGLERLRAAEILLRSGAFGLVVIEAPAIRLPASALSRLHALARHHHARVVFRCPHQADASLGSLIALRLEAVREQDRLHLHVLKSKTGSVETPTLKLVLPEGSAPQTSAQIELFPNSSLRNTGLRNAG